MGRYIIEFGMGTDFHGQDVTKAACKAVKDAVSRSCLCGLHVPGLYVPDFGDADDSIEAALACVEVEIRKE